MFLALHPIAASPQTARAAPDWLADPFFWIAVALLAALLVTAVGVWALVVRVREVREEAKRLVLLEDVERSVGRLVAEREDLDVRRLEHVLIDLRDGQRRLEDALLRVVERERGSEPVARDLLAAPAAESIAERLTNRLLALGFSEVHLVTRTEELPELLDEGEVVLEAKRDGVLYKGRAVLAAGRIADVDMSPAFSIFP